MSVHPRRKNSLGYLVLSAFAGWLGLILTYAALYLLLVRQEPPELGFVGAFIVFAAILSAFHFTDFVLIALPCYFLLLPRLPRIRWWKWSVCGGALYVASIPIWIHFGHTGSDGAWLMAALAFAGGFVSFFILSPGFYEYSQARLEERSDSPSLRDNRSK